MTEVDTDKSVKTLCSILETVYGKKAIILVDEYDYRIQNIHSDEETRSFIECLKPFMEQTFKFNNSIKTGVITGIVPLIKASMLSSFNNACMCTILDPMSDEYFGFTDHEVNELLTEAGESGKIGEVRKWYRGYRFGDSDIYNPYSIMMYLKNRCVPGGYWTRTGPRGISEDILFSMGSEPLTVLKELYENKGSVILSPIDGNISYSEVITPSARPSVVYSYLVMTGYLKAVRTDKQEGGVSLCEIGMVNEEVAFAFETLVKRATEVEVAFGEQTRSS